MNKIWPTIAVLGFVELACLERYEIVGIAAGGEGAQGIGYRLDRWTGEVVYFQGAHGGIIDLKG